MKLIKSFLNCFQILGLSPSIPSNGDSDRPKFCVCLKLNKFLSVLPLLLQSTIPLTLILMASYDYYTGPWEKYHIFFVMGNFFNICEVGRAFSISFGCLFYRQQFLEFIDLLSEINVYFMMHLYHTISHKRLVKRFFCQILIIFVAYIVYISMFFVNNILRQKNNPNLWQIKLIKIIIAVNILHSAFYINALDYYLEQLVFVIHRDTIDEDLMVKIRMKKMKLQRYRDVQSKLRHYKMIHIRIWDLAQLINQFFGWYLTAQFTQMYVEFLYTLYWLFRQFKAKWTWIGLICKYNFLYLII